MRNLVALLLFCCTILQECEGGYFRCPTFGLKSVHGKFLSAQPNGNVEWNRSWYRSLEQIAFEQEGDNTGYLRSYHGKYLAATPSHNLEWNRSRKGSYERFTIDQYEDKVSFRSSHGRYLSAQSDGSVDVDRTWQRSLEWFTVYPQRCLTKIECDCSKSINRDDYDFAGVEYHVTGGRVRAYRPEMVGDQMINNTDSPIEQSMTFSVNEKVRETASFSQTAGASVTMGTSFSAGVPGIGQGTVSAEVSVSYEFSAGTERSVTRTVANDYNCVAAPDTIVYCEAFLFKFRMTVPYTQTWQHKRLPCTCKSEGVFTELVGRQMTMNVRTEYPDD